MPRSIASLTALLDRRVLSLTLVGERAQCTVQALSQRPPSLSAFAWKRHCFGGRFDVELLVAPCYTSARGALFVAVLSDQNG